VPTVWDKLVKKLFESKSFRFKELEKILVGLGYVKNGPRGSHYGFKKAGCAPITIPYRKETVGRVYVKLVKNAVILYNNGR